MADEATNGAINGRLVVLELGGVIVAGQRDMGITQSRDEIDASDKRDPDEVTLPGRSTREINLEALYIPGDAERLALQQAYDDAAEVNIKVLDQGTGGVDRSATAVVLQMDENHPDQDVSTYTTRLKLQGGWS